jgi:hypothetical protein
MNLAVTNLALFETNKEQRQDFVSQVISNIEEGNNDPLKIHLQVKCLEDIIKQLSSHPLYKENILAEAQKFGKSFEHHNAKFEIKEMGVKYDYSNCGDPIYNELQFKKAELDEKIKEREKLLKSVPLSGMEIIVEDELIKVFPPTKTSTTSISVNLK